MIRWWEVPHDTLEIRDRHEALTRRALDARTAETLRSRDEYDPDRHAVVDARPLTAEEWAEVLAYGHALARHYAHPADLGRAVRAGMSWSQVAEAIGPDGGPAEARAAYREWATGQRRLNAREPGSTIGMTAEEYAEALALAAEPDPGGAAGPAAAEEDVRAAAVRELEAAAADRRAADRRTWDAVLAARAAGVPVRRTAELAGISPDTVQRWTQAAARGETGPGKFRP
ncbi:helix-turn-helix domain-containing protein [Actinomadura formosensis]|uniref:helix-turn-helix domain-containing protein n=1 Tax=Actinomadura formosensis TaxID=60706 RepID=UPI00082CB706|nr:helix-turn-helix domain-containing protein [Actinomadura formosensis]